MGIFAGLDVSTQFDPDAGAFINATGIGGIEAVAINNLVNQLKSAGLWSQMKAIYPMVGGTAQSCKFNLVNPQDTNAAFRLNFQGGWTFDSGGAKPDGVANTYADTYFSTSAQITPTNGHISYYSTTQSSLGGGMVEMGNDDGGNEINVAPSFGNTFYAFYAGAGGGGTNNSSSQGFYITNRGTNTEGWRNGTRIVNTGAGTVSVPTRVLYLACQNNGTTSNRNSDRKCAFSSIGFSLNSPTNFTNIVNTFCTTLQRNTF